MGQFGASSSFYSQNELESEIDIAVDKHKNIYKSRSHFINVAVVRELRRIKEHDESKSRKNQDNEHDFDIS